MRLAFTKHFAGSCNDSTTIGDLNHYVQGRNESTQKYVKRWAALWANAVNIVTPPGSGLDKSRSPFEISLTMTSRIYRGIADPRVRRYTDMLCVLGMPTKQSPTGLPLPGQVLAGRLGMDHRPTRALCLNAHIITMYPYQQTRGTTTDTEQ